MRARLRALALTAATAVLTSPVAVADPAAPADPAVPADPAAVIAAPPLLLADGVPHLPSPQNLPPGTTATPPQGGNPTLTYLRDVWHAVRNQDITPSDALLLIAQRPMSVPPN